MASKTGRKHRVFVLEFGSAEDSWMSCLVMRHRRGFDKPEEALKDIGEAFVEAFREEHQGRRHACCEKATSRFCPDCGHKLGKETGPTEDDIAERVCEFAASTAVECGQGNWEALDQRGWEMGIRKGNFFKDGFIHIEENAEHMIAAAVHGTLGSSCYTERSQISEVRHIGP